MLPEISAELFSPLNGVMEPDELLTIEPAFINGISVPAPIDALTRAEPAVAGPKFKLFLLTAASSSMNIFLLFEMLVPSSDIWTLSPVSYSFSCSDFGELKLAYFESASL